jgi:DNA-binding transcriptional ArsR family regulator
VRLRVIDRLGHGGPATVTELATGGDLTLPQLSNHLRRLREAGLVRVTRSGRHAIYELADPGLQALLPLLDRLTGRLMPAPEPPASDFASARSCYEHLAGRLGVELYRVLLERDALRSQRDGVVGLGPAAAESLSLLGVDPDAVPRDRRILAFECFDATEHASHLAGALGDAIAASLADRGWTEREPGSRVVRVTGAGGRALRAFGASVPA